MAMTFLHALRLNARRFPTKPAVVFEGRSQTYMDLLDRVERMMTVLARRGIGPGDKVAVISENHPDFLAAYGGDRDRRCPRTDQLPHRA
jgi:acyl-CoA synthetase (AMP-forming)/AMP-acid ligase II